MSNSIINSGLKNSVTYQAYRDLVKNLVEENASTGPVQNDDLANYTRLNDKRMKRWDKTIKITEDDRKQIEAFDKKSTWLVITESWCGDAAHVLPAINKMAELNDNIDMKVVLRDENLELIDAFLTNGGRAIPKVIMIDDATGEVLNTFGPRPSEATNLVNRFKAENGGLTPEFKEDLQHWYNKDKGQNIIKDVAKILKEVSPFTVA
ncbi:thioredoxin family protein [Algibacter lectus]|uniref:Thioredoxin-like protein n=1 Tax=Algibacter lectus TaxID=221126 RepID=A0A4R8MFP3_9FLAO|nr:thioredoxin family protein [Algibacter lectus]MDO7136852.1 thioredoxin family protein [Algibacter lectus]MWW24675.1 thioredoxin family protein [Algibacter lectus]TDY62696.1 thioredoxin-like protein [Algibacter lectus]SFC93372.1 Thioredoxin [Algibacter lectus]